MKPLFNCIEEAMKSYEVKTKTPRQMGGKWMKAESGNMTASFLLFNDPSKYGIDKGRISKLEIRDKDKKFLANYDRGWDVEPLDDETKKFYQEIIKKYN